MKEKIKEIFDLERIREYTEANINLTEWIEEECGEKRKILEVATLFHGANGAISQAWSWNSLGRQKATI